jgi:hypothetical protein
VVESSQARQECTGIRRVPKAQLEAQCHLIFDKRERKPMSRAKSIVGLRMLVPLRTNTALSALQSNVSFDEEICTVFDLFLCCSIRTLPLVWFSSLFSSCRLRSAILCVHSLQLLFQSLVLCLHSLQLFAYSLQKLRRRTGLRVSSYPLLFMLEICLTFQL